MAFYFLLLFVLKNIICESEKIIKVNITKVSGKYSLPLRYKGLSKIRYDFLNQEFPYSLLHIEFTPKYEGDEFLEFLGNSTLEDKVIMHFKDEVEIKNPNNDFSQVISFPFHFYLFEPYSEYNSFYGLSLAYKFSDYNFSLVHQLYKKNSISRKAFGIRKITENTSEMVLGGFKDKPIGEKKTCKILTEGHLKWGCKMKKVVVKGKVYYGREYSYVNIGEEKILAPKNFILFMANGVLQEQIKERKCKYFIYDSSDKSSYFECEKSVMASLPEIEFFFGESVFSVPMKELFEERGPNIERSLIQLNNKNLDQWVLGTTFTDKYNIEFDYEEAKVFFYGETKKTVISEGTFAISKKIIIIIIIVLIIGIIGISFNVKKN